MERKKTKMKNKLLYILIAIVIIAGIVVGYTAKFKFSLAYDDSIRVEMYIGKDYTKADVEAIAKEAFGTKEVLIQKIEFFNDSVAITVRESNDEKLNNLVAKVNEKYGTTLAKEDLTVVDVPHYRGRDIMSNYIVPIVISAVLIIVYSIIRFRKIELAKVVAKLLIWPIIVEALYLSILAIARIPISYYTLPLGIILAVLTLTIITYKNEKKLVEYNRKQK
ncbi:MAG TPA: hypothetical protein OIM48_08300 [Clostridiaceae bacterium]|nr:hypothetical protein [Clostridium sp.]MEE0126870.1 hypothetical protein [Clostridia bacterium]HJJ13268.1 hypothetical protein [Clostridiaceae bacterium]